MWIMPTRQRPHNLERFIKAYKKTHATDRIYVRLDEDDPSLDQYEALLIDRRRFLIRIGLRTRMPGALNEAFREFPFEACYGIMGDDIVPRTDFWDWELFKAAGLWSIAYGRDGLNDRAHAAHPLMGGHLARAWGRLAIAGLTHLYNDTVWMEIGKRLDCLNYCPHVYTEHMHFSNGKAPMDKIYNRMLNGENYAASDGRVFEIWKNSPGTQSELNQIKRLRNADCGI